MKKYIMQFILIAFTIIILLIPVGTSNLVINLYLDEFVDSTCIIYYGKNTNPGFCDEQVLVGVYSPAKNCVSVTIPGDVAANVTTLRMDFAEIEQLLSIREVTLTSAGITQKTYNPCDFFADSNIAVSNGINGKSLIDIRNMTYFSTSENDPYIIFTDAFCKEIVSHTSSFLLTKIFICCFIWVTYLLYKLNSRKNSK